MTTDAQIAKLEAIIDERDRHIAALLRERETMLIRIQRLEGYSDGQRKRINDARKALG